jgi:hypothetical protein
MHDCLHVVTIHTAVYILLIQTLCAKHLNLINQGGNPDEEQYWVNEVFSPNALVIIRSKTQGNLPAKRCLRGTPFETNILLTMHIHNY